MTYEDPSLKPWDVLEAQYPASGTTPQQIRFLLRFAILAPSGHNTQPWLFRVLEQGVELCADRTRALPVVDPIDRALGMSCGAALENFRVAARHFGHECRVELMPDRTDDDLLARIELEPVSASSNADDELFAAIATRHTNRRAYEDRDVPDALVDHLVTDAQDLGAWLYPLRGDDRIPVAVLVAQGDRIQMADKRFRRELAAWVRPNRSRSGDGIRGYGFGFGDLMSHGGPLVIRSFDLGDRQAATDRALVEGSPLLAVVGTDAEGPARWLAAGEAMQRILLRSCAAGVSASFMNQPIEVDDLRSQLARAIGRDGFPQLLLRFGYGPPADPQPRRPVDEVLLSA